MKWPLCCLAYLSIAAMAGCDSTVQTVPLSSPTSSVKAVVSLPPSTFVTVPAPNGFTLTFGLNHGAPSSNSVSMSASTMTSNGVRMLVGEFTTSQNMSGAALAGNVFIAQSQSSKMVSSSLSAFVQSELGSSSTQSSSRTTAASTPIAANILLENAGTGDKLASGFIPGGSDMILPTSINPAAANLTAGTTYRITIAAAADQPINVGGN
jgi:hypothetical protein